jgi:hypothetical protein
VHDLGQSLAGEWGLKHLNGEVVDLSVLEAPASEFTGVDINGRGLIDYATTPRGGDVGDVPVPVLPGTGPSSAGAVRGTWVRRRVGTMVRANSSSMSRAICHQDRR